MVLELSIQNIFLQFFFFGFVIVPSPVSLWFISLVLLFLINFGGTFTSKRLEKQVQRGHRVAIEVLKNSRLEIEDFE